jgi:hypothetical protein
MEVPRHLVVDALRVRRVPLLLRLLDLLGLLTSARWLIPCGASTWFSFRFFTRRYDLPHAIFLLSFSSGKKMPNLVNKFYRLRRASP